MTAELAARRTAAAAVLADFRRSTNLDYAAGTLTTEADWLTWALRLAQAAASVLDVTEPEPGHADLTPADLRTVLDALDVAADYKRDRAANCPDCETSPADLCSTCEWRLHIADGYDALARRLENR